MSAKSTRDKILEKYLKVCKDAATDDEVFRTFKSHPHYHEVLEHCPYNIGLAHWDNINDDYFNPEDMAKFRQNDVYGNPTKYRFGSFSMSATTVQYISVLSNLIREFGDLSGFRICEIGGGYGGQAKIILDVFGLKSYTCIDLEECTHLQKKYLGNFGYNLIMQFQTNENYEPREYDLFISNYALTEVSPSDQLKYVQDICLNCKRGYITANQPLNGLELLQEKFNVKILPDIEGERKSNFVIVWTE